MDYGAAVAWLTGRGWSRIEPGLTRVRALLDGIGAAPDRLPGVLVAGTNGKGSTCAMAVAALAAAGHRVAGVAEDPGRALEMAAAAAAPGRPIVVTGSLYLVGAVREALALPPG